MSVQFIKSAEQQCQELLNYDEIRFAGIINKLGNLIAGGPKPGIQQFETEEKNRMMYMQMVLDLSMRQEFDGSLGEVEYISSQRRNVLMISVPLKKDLLLISAKPSASTDKIILAASRIFSEFDEVEDIV